MSACLNDPLFLIERDPFLAPYEDVLIRRWERTLSVEKRLAGEAGLRAFAQGHRYYGLHSEGDGWVFREWAPNATAMCLIGAFNGWRESEAFALRRFNDRGDWEVRLPFGALGHGDPFRLRLRWPGGGGDRIPTYARRAVQDPETHSFNAQVWRPETSYPWRHAQPPAPTPLLIYEAHVGMAQEWGRVGAYDEFREHILPRIASAGYNAIQLMAVMEHPYYGSFGYHVSNFFAVSSRFGTPEALKALIDEAHGMGLIVIMDIVHSHAVMNEIEGLSRFDGTLYQFFHDGRRGRHEAWDSRCFDFGKPEVLHFLLSNCRFWLDEYRFDGFRFDGVTSMLYSHHGLGVAFTDYGTYFDGAFDEDAWVYLGLANKLVHAINPDAVMIAEDVSGHPGLAQPPDVGGCGFDYRLAMGVADLWERTLKAPDESWRLAEIWRELTNRRVDEKTVGYAESHDQALVGSKTLAFQLMDAAMYDHMRIDDDDPQIERGVALHKLIRLATLLTCGHGYLNFMGNEFGHPEWIDFPREGNNWSYHYARRQWHLRDDANLKYACLADFDRAMLDLVRREKLIGQDPPRLLTFHESDKVLAFFRRELCFIFNWHPWESWVDYALEALPGRYAVLLDSDDRAFAGHGRREGLDVCDTEPVIEGDVLKHSLRLYLPSRTALVIRRSDEPPEPAYWDRCLAAMRGTL